MMLGGKRSSSLPMYGVTQTQLSTQQSGACAAATEISGQQKNVGVAPFPLLPSLSTPTPHRVELPGTRLAQPVSLHMPRPATTAGSPGAHVGTCALIPTYVCTCTCVHM